MAFGICRRGIMHLVLVLVSSAAPVAAQDAQAPAAEGESRGAWTLVGVDGGLGNRWRTSVRLGYLTELDTRVWIVEVTYVAVEAVQVLVGHVYLAPDTPDSATSALRAGVLWSPVRGRITLDNRFLIERRSAHRSLSHRGRDRLRLSWSSGGRIRLVVFGSVETFATARVGFVEVRYQAGAAHRIGPATAEVYWVQRRTRAGLDSNSIGLTAFWRIGTG